MISSKLLLGKTKHVFARTGRFKGAIETKHTFWQSWAVVGKSRAFSTPYLVMATQRNYHMSTLEQMSELQKLNRDKLLKQIPIIISSLVKDKEIPDEDREKIKKLKTVFSGPTQASIPELLEFRDIFTRYFDFRLVRSKTLLNIWYFIGWQPRTGLGVLNKILSYFNINIPIDHPNLDWYSRRILHFQIRRYIDKLRKEDSILDFNNIGKSLFHTKNQH